MDLKKYFNKVNTNLVKCVNKIQKQIMDIYEIMVIKCETDSGSTSEEHVPIKTEPGYMNIAYLTSSLEKLAQKIEQFKVVCGTKFGTSFEELADLDVDLKNESNISSVTKHLTLQVSNLTEQTSFLLEIYKTDDNNENAPNIKRCLVRVNKNLKTILYNVYESEDRPSEDIDLNDLAGKIRLLSKKISKSSNCCIKRNELKRNPKDDIIESSELNEDLNESISSQSSPKKKKRKKLKTDISDVQDTINNSVIPENSTHEVGESVDLLNLSEHKKGKKRNDKHLEIDNETKTPHKKSKKDKTLDSKTEHSNADKNVKNGITENSREIKNKNSLIEKTKKNKCSTNVISPNSGSSTKISKNKSVLSKEINLSDEENQLYEQVESNKVDLFGNEKLVEVKIMLEETMDQDKLSSDVEAQLEVLFIQPTWEIPETHRIETRLVSGPKSDQKEQLLKLGIKCGSFTKEEDKIIKSNFQNFCKAYDFAYDATPFLCFQNDKKILMHQNERIKFIQYLGQNLSHRMLSSIYRRFRVLYTSVKKGRFTPDEDSILLSYSKSVKGAKQNDPMFSPLVKILNRSRQALQTRYNHLLKADNKKNIKWTLELNEKLLQLLMKFLNIKNLQELRDKEIKHSAFEQIGSEMDLPPCKVKVHWLTRLYTQLFAGTPLRFDKMKVEIAEKLMEMKMDDWKTVNWQDVASHFDGVSSHFLAFLAKGIVRHNVPPEYHSDLKKCLKYLKKYHFEEGKPISENRLQLCRYRLNKDGTLSEYK